MKRSHNSIFFLVVLAAVIFGCKNDDAETVVFPYSNIVSYNVPGQVGSAMIDKAKRTVTITLPFDTDLEHVVPTVGISSNATVVPASGATVNFKTNNKVGYVVTSESGNKSEWTVNVELTGDPEAIQLELIPNTGGWESEFTVYHDLSYNKFLTRSSGWNGGDGCVTTELPDGSLLWSFQDSFFGLIDNNRSRSNNTFARNAGFIQKNKSLYSYVQLNPGTNENTDTWVRYPGANANDDDKWYWGGPSQVINNEVQMLMGQIQPAQFAGVHVSTDIAIFDTEMNFKELIQDKYVGELAWDGSIFKADDGYTYMYTQKNYGICAAKIYVARVPGQDLRGTWEYYTTDGWVSTAPTDIDKYIAVLDGTATQANVFKKGDKYYFVTQGTCFGLDILIYESTSPTGPFTNQRKLYTIPDKYTQDADPKFITYNAVVHHGLSKEGELVISYNINPIDFGDNFNTPGSADNYRPYFVRVYNWESN
jgi:hypothetical protein